MFGKKVVIAGSLIALSTSKTMSCPKPVTVVRTGCERTTTTVIPVTSGSSQVSVTTGTTNAHTEWNNDPLCRVYEKGTCKECSYRSYMKNGKCTAVSDLCKTFDASTGACTSCYPGDVLRNGACSTQEMKNSAWEAQTVPTWTAGEAVKPMAASETVTLAEPTWPVGEAVKPLAASATNAHTEWNNDPLCRVYEKGTCKECSYRSYMKNGKCTAVSDLCKTFDASTGACTSCYPGDVLRNGACSTQEMKNSAWEAQTVPTWTAGEAVKPMAASQTTVVIVPSGSSSSISSGSSGATSTASSTSTNGSDSGSNAKSTSGATITVRKSCTKPSRPTSTKAVVTVGLPSWGVKNMGGNPWWGQVVNNIGTSGCSN